MSQSLLLHELCICRRMVQPRSLTNEFRMARAAAARCSPMGMCNPGCFYAPPLFILTLTRRTFDGRKVIYSDFVHSCCCRSLRVPGASGGRHCVSTKCLTQAPLSHTRLKTIVVPSFWGPVGGGWGRAAGREGQSGDRPDWLAGWLVRLAGLVGLAWLAVAGSSGWLV